MRTIVSKRLNLVPVTPDNSGVLWSVLQQPDLREFQDLPELDAAAFKQAVAQRPAALRPAASGRFEWIVYDKAAAGDADTPLGWVSLRVSDRRPPTGEIGYTIVAARRGNGIATEAVAALLEEGFSNAGLAIVRAYCIPENMSSKKVLSRNGFRSDGLLPHGATVKGRPVDVLSYSLARERWESRRSELKRFGT